jgi:hypothetical protein
MKYQSSQMGVQPAKEIAMKLPYTFPYLAATTLMSSLYLSPVATATPRCEKPSNSVDRIACAKAKESPEALRRYIAKTSSIHQLEFSDYMSDAELEQHRARIWARPKPQSTPVEQVQKAADRQVN